MNEPHDRSGPPHLAVLPGGSEGRPDEALVRAFLGGDEAAFGELWRRHAPAVHGVVRRFARRPEDSADLVQRAFLRALEAARRRGRLAGLRGPLPFRPFIVRVALNLARNHARDEARWRRAPVEEADGEAGPRAESQTRAAETAVLRAEREGLVRDAVAGLPRRQREVLSLRIDAGLPFAEVARTLGISENAAKVHFHHAARRLRDAVGSREGEP